MAQGKHFLGQKKLKSKLLLQFGVVVAFTLLLVLIVLFSYKQISKANSANAVIQDLHLKINELQKETTLFVQMDLNNDSLYEFGKTFHLALFNDKKMQVGAELDTLVAEPVMRQLGFSDSLKVIQTALDTFSDAFTALALKYKQRGVKDWGLQGELNRELQAMEGGTGTMDKDYVLQLRRQVETFHGRKDPHLLALIDFTANDFRTNTTDKNLPEAIARFLSAFHQYLNVETQIGLNQNQGLRGKMNGVFNQVEPVVERLNKRSKEYVDEVILRSIYIVLAFFVLQLVLVLVFANVFSNAIVSSIHLIKNGIQLLSEGVFPDKIVVQEENEVGEISEGFNNIVDRMRVASAFAVEIGNGQLDVHYDNNFNNDVLAQALTRMHEKLLEVREENEKRNWVSAGLNAFSAVLRQTDDASVFYEKCLKQVIKYLHANQGYLYIMQDDEGLFDTEPAMELMAVYAYGKPRYLEEKKLVRYQEGLIGQAWFDKEPLFFTAIPEDYVKITSGIGEALPRNIYICPMIFNDKVLGAIEIASFEVLQPHEREYVNKVMEDLGSIVSNLKVSQRTKFLLEQSHQQS